MKVLCFSPNDAIWNWAFPQALALEALQQRGHEIVYVSCEREFEGYCMSMAASGVRFEAPVSAKNRICSQCVRQTRIIQHAFDFRGYPIGAHVQQGTRADADRLSTAGQLEELFNFEHLGVPVGRLALYETIIHNKLSAADIDGPVEAFYRAVFRNTYVAVAGMNAIIELEKPDVCVTYHTAYAYNRGFQLLSVRHGLPVYFFNAGLNVSKSFRQLIVAKADPEDFTRRLLAKWPHVSDMPRGPDTLASVTEHLIALIGGAGFAYSIAMTGHEVAVLARLGVPQGRRILVATMSSYDELLASEKAGFGWTTHNNVFASQVDWIIWLFSFMSRRPDLHLVVRVHPREFQVRGSGVRSQHSFILEEAFEKHPPNVTINWPADKIPLYELFFETDVVLNAWSSAGMEAGLLGIPVVSHCGDVLLFPRRLTVDVTHVGDYESAIETALAEGWSLDRVRAYYRWAALMLEDSAVDIDDAVGSQGSALASRVWRRLRRPWEMTFRPTRLREAEAIVKLIERDLAGFYDMGDGRQSKFTVEEETQALHREMRRVSTYIMGVTGATPGRLATYF